MALDIGAGGLWNVIDHGSDASLDNLTTWTSIFWTYLRDVSQRTIQGKATAGWTSERTINFHTVDEIAAYIVRAGADTDYQTNNANLTANVWSFIAVTFDIGGAAGQVVNIYRGDLATLLTECTYGVAIDGGGALADDSAADLYIANQNNVADSIDGIIAVFGHWNRVLTLGELQAQQWWPRPTDGCVVFSHYGHSAIAVGNQPDWSGNGNAGTSSAGITLADHVSLGPPFGFDLETAGIWEVAVPAVSIPVMMYDYRRRRID